jgi:hypothetical protein
MSASARTFNGPNVRSVTFRSKLDGWIVTSILAGGAFPLFALVILSIVTPRALLVAPPLFLLALAFVAWLYFATQYVVTAHRLIVRGVVARLDVPLDQITRIEPTHSMVSAPAWSFDRLRISYGQGRSCMISPRDRDRFLSLLRERCVNVA